MVIIEIYISPLNETKMHKLMEHYGLDKITSFINTLIEERYFDCKLEDEDRK